MSNFDFLLSEPEFSSFAQATVNAERLFRIDTTACVLSCRRAAELAVKWMYSVDAELEKPTDERFVYLISGEAFRDIVGKDLHIRLEYIRKTGNNAAHAGNKITPEQACLCLENLHDFMDFVECCYGSDDNYQYAEFDPSLIPKDNKIPQEIVNYEIKLIQLIEENKSLKEQLTARRVEQSKNYSPKPLELSEYDTRKLYIDAILSDIGWVEGKNWLNEVELKGMSNKSEAGFADYVLYGNDGKPLAVVEAKRTCKDVSAGRQQAKLYADILETQHGRRPIVFLTNGFETRIDDGIYPERKVAFIYSKRDLDKLFNLRTNRVNLKNICVDKKIAGRYYQEGAVKAVCTNFDEKKRRKALLVMATGSGKTRTVIALCDVLLRTNWIKNILFLADRNSLVTQAKRSFANLLPNLSVTNLCEEKDNYNAHCVFSTYQTMMNVIDSACDTEGKLYTCGHFDLVICDEAHRSIYNKYKDIFTYFDAPLVGLTATPKDEIDKNTYEIFELEKGVPTYGYELSQAVKDGYLVDFLSVETRLKFIEQGIIYDKLSDEDKEEYEDTFADENGNMPESISSSALNEWLFNADTIREVLNVLMTDGQKINYGQKIGKTIIFARNHNHAEKIFEVFNKEYSHLRGYAAVVDNYINYSQSAIDEFSDSNKLPQIAISVDMLDTGIDVPEVLNLVFFKKVLSKAKLWQMIGRGTRLCPGLIDGMDKSKFYIFDFCGNFEFFRMNKGKESASAMALQSAIFLLKSQIVYTLREQEYQTNMLINYRNTLVDDMIRKVSELDKSSFNVRQHLKFVEKYSIAENYTVLSYEDTLKIKEELAPLIIPDEDDARAIRFDALMYEIELALLAKKGCNRHRSDLVKKVSAMSNIPNIPEIIAQTELINKVLKTDYLEKAGIEELENLRVNLRNLTKYLFSESIRYDTNFNDEILSVEWNESELDNDDLKNYRAKAEYYIREHQDNPAVVKLKSNIPLSEDDVKALEQILWEKVGTKEDYLATLENLSLGKFVRSIVGLEMSAAKEAFSEFLNEQKYDARQIYFVNQIVEYIVHNGIMEDLSVLQEPPFTDRGSVADIFNDMSVWLKIRKVIEMINSNAA